MILKIQIIADRKQKKFEDAIDAQHLRNQIEMLLLEQSNNIHKIEMLKKCEIRLQQGLQRKSEEKWK